MDMHYGITDSKPWGWSRRQSSRQMSFANADYYSGEMEYAAAVAAAAFAINNLDSSTRSQNAPKMARPYERASHDEESRRYGPTLAEKIISQVPSMKRTPTFSGSKKYSEEDIQSKRPEINTEIPTFPPPPKTTTDQFGGPRNSRFQESEADAWERAQLGKIKQRYEKLNTTIREWEDKKRTKAERKLRSTEGELGKKRAKALQSYQNDIERIRQVAEGARVQAKEKRRREELKVKEMANKYRTTGQLPRTCLCF